MTSGIIEALRMPQSGHGHAGRAARGRADRPYTLPCLSARRTAEYTYGFTAIDVHGRLAVPNLVALLGWEPGTRLTVSAASGLLVLTESSQGTETVTARRHVRLPARERHWHRLVAGTRLLVVADPGAVRLVIHSPANLDGMITRSYEALGRPV